MHTIKYYKSQYVNTAYHFCLSDETVLYFPGKKRGLSVQNVPKDEFTAVKHNYKIFVLTIYVTV